MAHERSTTVRFTLWLVVLLVVLSVASRTEAQIAAAVVPPGNQGVLKLDANGNGVFALIAANLGPTPGYMSAGVWCGGFDIKGNGPEAVYICTLNTATGACLDAPAEVLSPQIESGKVGTFGVLVIGGTPGGRVSVTLSEWRKPFSSPFHCGFEKLFGPERAAISIGMAQ